MQTKAEIRKQLKVAIDAIPLEEKLRQSSALCDRLLADSHIRNTRGLGVYLPLPDEPDLRPALQLLLESGTELALPFPDETGDGWTFRRIHSLQTENTGPWNLPFPKAGESLSASELETVLVPGRGFTIDGKRIGRGKGYYDRLLETHSGRRIGIGFSCQLVESLPFEAHDVKLSEIWVG